MATSRPGPERPPARWCSTSSCSASSEIRRPRRARRRAPSSGRACPASNTVSLRHASPIRRPSLSRLLEAALVAVACFASHSLLQVPAVARQSFDELFFGADDLLLDLLAREHPVAHDSASEIERPAPE